MRKHLFLLSTLAIIASLFAASPASSQASPAGVVPLPPVEGGAPGPETYAFAGEEVARTRADTWHLAGVTGEGVTIGIVGPEYGMQSWLDAFYLHEVPSMTNIPTLCLDGGQECDTFTGDFGYRGDKRGVALAEVVHDMAPSAHLALAVVHTTADLEAAVQFFVDEGVDIVIRTDQSTYESPGDGTGATDEALDAAVTAGITVVQAVGNAGNGGIDQDGGYYRWTYQNEDHDEWVEFDDQGDERLRITTCGQFRGLRWDDFGEGTNATDYNLAFFKPNHPDSVAVAAIHDQQQPGVLPIEHNEPCFFDAGPWDMGVRLVDPGTTPDGDVLEVLGEGMTFEHSTSDGAAAGPGEDSVNPGVVTVGALSSARGGAIDPASSQGPSGDTDTPDLTAAACLSTYSLATCFRHTDAASAVVAGAAALYLDEHPGAAPADVATWLTTDAVMDRGMVGPDDVYGAGELRLPSRGPRPRYRPDARIQAGARGPIVGDNVFTPTGARQNVTMVGRRGREVRFTVTLQNQGNAPERFLLGGSRSAFGYQVNYYLRNVRYLDLFKGEHSTAVVQPGGTLRYQIGVKVPGHPQAGGVQGVLQVFSQTTLRQVDAVRFTVLDGH